MMKLCTRLQSGAVSEEGSEVLEILCYEHFCEQGMVILAPYSQLSQDVSVMPLNTTSVLAPGTQLCKCTALVIHGAAS